MTHNNPLSYDVGSFFTTPWDPLLTEDKLDIYHLTDLLSDT